MVKQVLSGHTSADTAYVVADYPYGFRLRCQKRYWVETKQGHGQRVVSQTSNPKKPGLVWNAPKASTYSNVRVLYLDEQDYVQNAALNLYSSVATVDAFEKDFGDALKGEHEVLQLRLLRAIAQKMEAREAARVLVAGGPS